MPCAFNAIEEDEGWIWRIWNVVAEGSLTANELMIDDR